jgi:hypothetical protein
MMLSAIRHGEAPVPDHDSVPRDGATSGSA